MSLSKTLQKHVLGLSRDTSSETLRRELLSCARRDDIGANLALFGLDNSDEAEAAPVQSLFNRLGQSVRAHPEQWYFPHEEIELVETAAAGAATPGPHP